MINNTFSMLTGVGVKMEKKLWQRGILTWDDFLRSDGSELISPSHKQHFDERITLAKKKLKEGNAVYFSEALQRPEHWRLFERFRNQAVCLDIETNGYTVEQGGEVTVVGIYDGKNYRNFVKGRNLSAQTLMEALAGYKLLITFYGSVFDVPFLEKGLKGFSLGIPHYDICFAARRVGFKGGLKKLENSLGIERDPATVGLDGYAAVLLWKKACRGDPEALDLLIKYNREDTVNLLYIADTVYRRLRASTGIEEYLK